MLIIGLPPVRENHTPRLHLWTDCRVITHPVLKRALEVLQNLARKGSPNNALPRDGRGDRGVERSADPTCSLST